jgi:hypothetical protein
VVPRLLEADGFTQADSEIGICVKRRGESLSLLDTDPNSGYFPRLFLTKIGFATSCRPPGSRYRIALPADAASFEARD